MDELEVEADVCERLARYPAMQSVWKALHRRAPNWQLGPRGHDGKLVREIVREVLEARWRSSRTPAQRRDALLEVAKKTRELRAAVKRVAADAMLKWSEIDEGVSSDLFDALEQLEKEASEKARLPYRRIKRTPNASAL